MNAIVATIWLTASLSSLLACALIVRSVARRRTTKRDVVRVRRVAQAFDVNPADADILAEVALLGGPGNPTLATTDRRAFDGGASLYLVRVFLEGGDVWESVFALSRLRERLGFEEDAPGSAFPAFLGPVSVVRAGAADPVGGIVVDRRGAMRVLVRELPAQGLAKGDLVEVRVPEKEGGMRFRVHATQAAGDGWTLVLHPSVGPPPTPRVPAFLPVSVRRPSLGQHTVAESGTLLDLSAGGACLRVPWAIPSGETVEIAIQFDASRVVELEGTSIWSAPGGGGRWRVGVRFDGVPEPTRAEILAFLAVQPGVFEESEPAVATAP